MTMEPPHEFVEMKNANWIIAISFLMWEIVMPLTEHIIMFKFPSSF